jgi:hypothetical protein
MAVTKELKNFTCNPAGSPIGPWTIDIPAGLRVMRIMEGGTQGCYWLNEFPKSVFSSPLLRMDAMNYGIVLTPEQVEEQQNGQIEG